jgi:pilus assembly protein CpaF
MDWLSRRKNSNGKKDKAERAAMVERTLPVEPELAAEPTLAAEVATKVEDAPSPETVEMDDGLNRIKRDLHRQVIAELDLTSISTMHEKELRLEVQQITQELCNIRSDFLSAAEQEALINGIMDDVFGLGPLEALLGEHDITDILINGPNTVYIERHGKLQLTDVKFMDDAHVTSIVQRIVGRIGRRIDETNPMVDARLPDGSRLNAIIPPLALDGPLVSIRRFGTRRFTSDDLLQFDSIAPDMLQFLAACIEARVNVLISGGTGSGKTTLLNVLSSYIPADERVATIEDAAELQLQQPHVVRMETRPANVEGKGGVDTRDLVRNALRMRPDRIVVGECRGAEALDMLQAMNTGHEGSMTTVHANTTRDATSRLEMMVGMAGFEVPIWTIRRQIASAIHIVVQIARLVGGSRKVIKISEITGMEGDLISMHDLFEFRQHGLDENRCAKGEFYATGLRPHCLSRMEDTGVDVPLYLFEERVLDSHVPEEVQL